MGISKRSRFVSFLVIFMLVWGYSSGVALTGNSVEDNTKGETRSAETSTDPYAVTFMINTSNIPDTLNGDDVVQIRGNLKATGDSADYGAQNITWGSGSTPVATHMGGDYWKVDVKMMPGDTLIHKFWAGFSLDPVQGVAINDGWELSTNYQFVYPSDATGDTTLPLKYFSTGEGRQSPFVDKADSVGVRFRVNVGRQIQTGEFDPDSHEVQVRGNLSPLTWDKSTDLVLSKQGEAGNNFFYSGIAYFHKDSIDAVAGGTIEYKFYANGWEEGNNRTLTFDATKNDTTVHFAYFSGEKPTEEKVIDTRLNFTVNVQVLERLGLFDPQLDSVEMRGEINNWAGENMSFSSVTNTWVLNDRKVTRAVGERIVYKYFVDWDDSRFDKGHKNYIPGIQPGNGWEEPGVTGGVNRSITIEDKSQHDTGEEFFNGVKPEGVITENKVLNGNNVEVTFQINMKPATQLSSDPFMPSSDSLYIVFETPFFAFTQDLVSDPAGINDATHPDSIERQRFTDADGDMVYELNMTLKNPTLNHIGFVVGYGKPFTGENLHTNGGGFEPGRRYYQYLRPYKNEKGQVVWKTDYTLPVLDWKATDLPWQKPPSYTNLPLLKTQSMASFETSLSVEDANQNSTTLTIGRHSNATTSFDENLDQLAPPPPPSGAFDARLKHNEKAYIKDLRGTDSSSVTWTASLQAADGGEPVTVTWDAQSLPDSGKVMMEAPTSGVRLNMQDTSSLTVSTDTTSELTITHNLEEEISVDYREGWNLVGLPVPVRNPHVQNLFPAARKGTLFGFNGSYVSKDSLRPGQGFWLRFSGPGANKVAGPPLRRVKVSLDEGWNLVAGPSDSVALSAVNDPNGIIMNNTLFGFEGSYASKSALAPGNGYWIRASGSGIVTFRGGAGKRKDREELRPEGFVRLQVSDADGRRQTLYFDGQLPDREKKSSYAMPPLPPDGAFDARFSNGRRLVNGSKATIELQGVETPLKIQVRGEKAADRRYVVSFGDKQKEVTKGQPVEYTASDDLRQFDIRLRKGGSIPDRYRLTGNYPNPFNPTTTIKYGLPEAADVRLTIYSINGRKVAEPVNRRQEAGWHKVTFDASRLASGVYVYRLQAGAFTKTRKMMLLK